MILAVVGLAACAATAGPEVAAPTIARSEELQRIMKGRVNPTFSNLSFLLLRGDEADLAPEELAAERQRNVEVLRGALAEVRALRTVPTRTEEGRAVFATYVDSVSRAADRLAAQVDGGDLVAATATLEEIAETCNACHHFFRLDIHDSVVPNRSTQLVPLEGAVAVAPGGSASPYL